MRTLLPIVLLSFATLATMVLATVWSVLQSMAVG